MDITDTIDETNNEQTRKSLEANEPIEINYQCHFCGSKISLLDTHMCMESLQSLGDFPSDVESTDTRDEFSDQRANDSVIRRTTWKMTTRMTQET